MCNSTLERNDTGVLYVELVQAMPASLSSISASIRNLEKKGLVALLRSEGGQVKRVELTSEGDARAYVYWQASLPAESRAYQEMVLALMGEQRLSVSEDEHGIYHLHPGGRYLSEWVDTHLKIVAQALVIVFGGEGTATSTQRTPQHEHAVFELILPRVIDDFQTYIVDRYNAILITRRQEDQCRTQLMSHVVV
jgi:DNA-binding MarR family transcriptional regulator